MSGSSGKRGFTLVEILVAMAIIVTIVSMVYGSYFATSKSAETCKAKMALSQQVRKVLQQMARQIRCSYADKAEELTDVAGTISREKSTVPEGPINYFKGAPDDLNGEILRLVTTNGLFCGPDQAKGLFDITYKFDKSSGTLSLSQRRFLHTSKKSVEQRSWRPLVRNVEYVELAFFDGQQWLNKWDFKQKKELPCAVRISITCKDENSRQYYYGTVAYVCCSGNQGKGTPSEALVSINK
ncbi:MAG: type II secretion system protein GspJ [Planctomycetota bacterium]|jgi:prepilin-type N-terminal cleavage/methylation domain-containing protein